MNDIFSGIKDALKGVSGANQDGGAKRRSSKKAVKPVAAKPKYTKSKKTVKCGDGVVRPVYLKDGKAYYRKKDSKTGKLVWRRAGTA